MMQPAFAKKKLQYGKTIEFCLLTKFSQSTIGHQPNPFLETGLSMRLTNAPLFRLTLLLPINSLA